MGWINVQRKLPKDGERVLVYDNMCNINVVVRKEDDIWQRYAWHQVSAFQYLYWRRLPEPPRMRKG